VNYDKLASTHHTVVLGGSLSLCKLISHHASYFRFAFLVSIRVLPDPRLWEVDCLCLSLSLSLSLASSPTTSLLPLPLSLSLSLSLAATLLLLCLSLSLSLSLSLK